MTDAVKPNGLIICMELSRNTTQASEYIHGIDTDAQNTLGIDQKLRRNIRLSNGTDYEIAQKLPVYMEEEGLKDVSVRMNDFISYVSPERSDYNAQYAAFTSSDYAKPIDDDGCKRITAFLEKRGLSANEAAQKADSVKETSQFIHDRKDSLRAVASNCMFISYGRRP